MAVTEIDPLEASRRLSQTEDDARPLLVDVREQGEFAEQRIPDATLLPMSRMPTDYQLLPSDRPLLIHCAHGQRSLAVAEFLARNGYPDVASVSGGIVAWAQAGLPTKTGSVEPGEGDLPSG
jgi:rhodanese-related sulfurtransferase